MNRPRLIARVCQACGQPFQARAADVCRGFGRACSPRCSGRLRRRPQPPASHPFTEGSHLSQTTEAGGK